MVLEVVLFMSWLVFAISLIALWLYGWGKANKQFFEREQEWNGEIIADYRKMCDALVLAYHNLHKEENHGQETSNGSNPQ